ncbi:MAG: GNAT family N-acetyltransferase [Leptolinea sp.]
MERLILETARLRLRYMSPEDIPTLIDLWTDADVTHFMSGPRNLVTLTCNLKETASNPLADPYDLWPLVEKSSAKVIGHCGLLDKDVEGKIDIELVYVLVKPAWGKGYATEIALALRDYAFFTRKVPRLIALIDPENIASERVASKVGMLLEKETVRPGGEVRYLYALYPYTTA